MLRVANSYTETHELKINKMIAKYFGETDESTDFRYNFHFYVHSEDYAHELYAMLVMLSDDYLRLENNNSTLFSWISSDHAENKLRRFFSWIRGVNHTENKLHRFFSIALRLPQELQMVLSLKTYGVREKVITQYDFDEGFIQNMKYF
jgi:hypothetical protein